MKIAQITDLHLGFDPADPCELNRQRLDRTVAALLAGPDLPDAVLVTGDLTESGTPEGYAALRDALAPLAMPVWPCLGNHDRRANFCRAFPQVGTDAAGFVQYEGALAGLRLLMLDTLEEGRHGGAFCAARADWLTAQLAKAPDVPTIIVMHHPPVAVGIDWMDPGADEPWIRRFQAAITGHDQVRAILCGHLHRPVASRLDSVTVTACPAIAPALTLDLRPIASEVPDGRAMLALEPPGYALHRWDGTRLVTHFASVSDAPVLVRNEGAMHAAVRDMLAERG